MPCSLHRLQANASPTLHLSCWRRWTFSCWRWEGLCINHGLNHVIWVKIDSLILINNNYWFKWDGLLEENDKTLLYQRKGERRLTSVYQYYSRFFCQGCSFLPDIYGGCFSGRVSWGKFPKGHGCYKRRRNRSWVTKRTERRNKGYW